MMANSKYSPTNTTGMLTHLIQEAAEVQQAATKILLFGFTKTWEGETNFQALQREMQDLHDAYGRLCEHMVGCVLDGNIEPPDFEPYGPKFPSATAVLVERQPVHVRRPGERTFPGFFSHDVAATPPMAAQVIEQRRRNGYCVCSDSQDAGDGICATCRMHLGAVP